ncbi:unnamed protein product [Meloidogyne enterolobii]|uniref:Uncharacterized protein n=1 Tax=Meloidogyne enterolobii TaxID=390850 RepID=A0ACB0YK84_MELEN
MDSLITKYWTLKSLDVMLFIPRWIMNFWRSGNPHLINKFVCLDM